ncbi:MAG TPA: DUF1127 domain-containing protein [Amaricoccus sp.]|uniref:DUF1127 domain-containing protein n=1 Tax=Amaricoccus sp. TaxID=1872485 RepID=UPI002C2C52AC|nr:DUF1127 domain-containing protein [Amaricoccus sp.]HMQ91687.1 DUF1127 domain-containing protein [Amaricoccus sp.]HMR36607.1 DUF1127 domain-containing protein [Paracoccus sp. (in: a-proteobacteria)]HMR52210.1 DUF1127 domain-containing protein [Amaricoccus sp.]HMT99062.1 DUF1127 domain-containing protein [Amaricoccus sp.]
MSGYLTSQMLDPAWRGHIANDGAHRLRQWMTAAVRRWQRSKMIQVLNDLDDWMLADIGIHRADIPRFAEELTDRELRMSPLAGPKTEADEESDAFQLAA